MRRRRVLVTLILSYALLGILMNSVGVVILQSIRHFDATKPMGSTLEACKDLSVVAASFVLATRVPIMGYRRSLAGTMLVMAMTCVAASFADRFLAMQALFVVTGLNFGVAKVATYATIGVLARDPAEHASITGLVEGVFMVGLLMGVWVFGWFIGRDATGTQWLGVYRLLAAAFAALALLWSFTPIDQPFEGGRGNGEATGWTVMVRLAVLPATVAVLAGLFLYVLVEQGVGTWLPTFNNQVIRLPAAMSVQMTSIFVGSLAIGRLFSGLLLRRADWLLVLLGCLAGIALLILISLPLARTADGAPTGWSGAPTGAYLFPLLGLFLAPIYPTICSVALSALPRSHHAAMMGLIVIFSALGGTIGSFLTGLLFQHVVGSIAFYATLVPVALIAMTLPAIRRRQRQAPMPAS